MEIAARNRLIKKVLTAEFGPCSVTGSRGTAYGWVRVSIDKRPSDTEERDAWTAKVWELFKANGIVIGTYGTPGDMGADYGWGSKINLKFGRPMDTFVRGERVTWNCQQGTIIEPNYRNPGWYMVQWDDAQPGKPEEFYKRDLTRIVLGVKPRVRVKAGRRVVETMEVA